jgi:hypothetical protein
VEQLIRSALRRQRPAGTFDGVMKKSLAGIRNDVEQN